MMVTIKQLRELRTRIGFSNDGKILLERLDKYNKAVASSDLTHDKKQKLYMMGKRVVRQRTKYFKQQDKKY